MALGEPVEKRRPARQAAEAGEVEDRAALAFLPDTARRAVDRDAALGEAAHSAASRAGARGTARAGLGSGLGHQRSSHSRSKRSRSCGITCSAKRRVLWLARSRLMLPNCWSTMRWPTLRSV